MNDKDGRPVENIKVPWPVIDAHAHFFPRQMFQAIWKFFGRGGWSIAYKKSADELAENLRAHGVAHYTTLNYVRKPGQAAGLNRWTKKFCEKHKEAIPFCTLHLDDPNPWGDVEPYLTDHGFRGVKIQPLVCEFSVDDPRLTPILDRLAKMDKILIPHTGTAPYANEWVGLEKLERALEKTPDLRVIIPHMGAYDVEKAFSLLERYPKLYLDTTMIFVNTDVFDTKPKVDMDIIERFSERILFGSDHPNHPYLYTEALDSIMRLEVSDETKKKIMYDNAHRLFFGK